MKLLAIIFIAAISVSSVVPSSGDTATHTCPEGFELDGVNCRQLTNGIANCPDGAVESNIGDKCVVDNKYCSLGLPNTQATVEDRTQRQCNTGYTFITAVNRCVKRTDQGALTGTCKYGSLRNGRCRWSERKQNVCPQNGTAPPDEHCLARRIPRGHCGCKRFYKVDPQNRNYCIFIEGSPESFCSEDTTEDPMDNRCVEEGYEPSPVRIGCNKGVNVYGRCEEVSMMIANVSCPLEQASTRNGNEGGLPFACFEGTVGGSESEKRCLVNKLVQPTVVCPANFTPSSINPTKCKSNITIRAS